MHMRQNDAGVALLERSRIEKMEQFGLVLPEWA